MPPAIPDKIACDTESQLEREINDLRLALDREETEETWEPMQRALARFKALVRGGAYRHDSFVPSLKPVARYLVAPMLSERGRLSAVAIDLASTIASAIGKRFDPLMLAFGPAIMKLCQRPNKVVTTRAQGCLTTVIKQTRLASILPFLRDALKEKSIQLRIISSEAVCLCLAVIEQERLASRISDIETIIKMTGRDASPEVRKHGRAILLAYRDVFPERFQAFIHPLTPVTRKYLDVQKAADFPMDTNPLTAKLMATSNQLGGTEGLARKAIAPPRPPPMINQPLRSDGASSQSTSHPVKAPSASSQHPASTHYKQATVAGVSAPRVASTSRPRSVHAVGQVAFPIQDPIERPRSIHSQWGGYEDPSRPQITAQEPVILPRVLSHEWIRTNTQPHSEPPEPRERQRSISVTSGMNERKRALSSMQRSEQTYPERKGDIVSMAPPRPPSSMSDRAPMRPASALSTRRDLNRVDRGRNERPISVSSDTLEYAGAGIIAADAKMDRPKSPLTSTDTKGHQGSSTSQNTAQRPINLSSETPRHIVERPTVVHLSQFAAEPPSRPRPQKNWSLSQQMERLKNRARPNEPKLEPAAASISSHEDVTPVEAAVTPIVNNMTPFQKVEEAPVTDALHCSEPFTVMTTNASAENSPAVTPDLASAELTAVTLPPPVNITPQIDSPNEETMPVDPSKPLQANARTRTNSGSSVSKTNNLQRSTKPVTEHVPRQRTVSATKDMKMPIRAPSRNGQSVGFVPKRTHMSSSIMQPTKSQAARAEALMKEKATSSANKQTNIDNKTASSKVNHAPKGPQEATKELAKQGFKPSSKLTDAREPSSRPHVRPEARKPPIPSTSSLVKSHAIRREAGLATVTSRLGGSVPVGRSVASQRSKAPSKPSKQILRSVEAYSTQRSAAENSTAPASEAAGGQP